MANVTNLYIDQGADYSIEVLVTDNVGRILDITGFSVKSQMRKSYGSSTAYTFTVDLTDPLNGIATLSFTASETRDIPAGRYLYDVEATNTVGVRWRIVEGLVIVTPEITKI